MRLSLAIFMAVTLCATYPGQAQEVRYDFTGSYDSTYYPAPTTLLTAPGAKYTFEFLVPRSVTFFTKSGYDLSVSSPILSGAYIFDGRRASVFSGTYSWGAEGYGEGGHIDLNTSVGAIHLNITESDCLAAHPLAALYPLPPNSSFPSHFLTGRLSPQSVDLIEFTPTHGKAFTVYPGGSTSVVGTPGPVPEPSSMGLLAVGVIFCGGVAWARRQRTSSPIRSP